MPHGLARTCKSQCPTCLGLDLAKRVASQVLLAIAPVLSWFTWIRCNTGEMHIFLIAISVIGLMRNISRFALACKKQCIQGIRGQDSVNGRNAKTKTRVRHVVRAFFEGIGRGDQTVGWLTCTPPVDFSRQILRAPTLLLISVHQSIIVPFWFSHQLKRQVICCISSFPRGWPRFDSRLRPRPRLL